MGLELFKLKLEDLWELHAQILDGTSKAMRKLPGRQNLLYRE